MVTSEKLVPAVDKEVYHRASSAGQTQRIGTVKRSRPKGRTLEVGKAWLKETKEGQTASSALMRACLLP
jgi:hypothetical protein